jgi:hypothetical protein
MARRSYLQNIAEPLSPGDPVLFSVPRAAADEARPAAVRQGPPGGAPASPALGTPVLRRKQAGDAAPTIASTHIPGAALSGPASAPMSPGFGGAGDAPITPGVPAAPVTAVAGASAEPPGARDESLPIAIAPLRVADAFVPAAGSGSTIPMPLAGAPELPWPPLTHVATLGSARAAAAVSPDSPGSAKIPAVIEHRTVAHASPVAMLPPVASVAPADRNGAAPVRLHIGTIEVRTTPPQVPPPAPHVPAAQTYARDSSVDGSIQVSRGYGWRFGLFQG